MPKFRKKPVVIEAIQFLGKENGGDVLEWTDFRVAIAGHRTDEGQMIPIVEIKTLEGLMIAAPGDWIIRGIQGELYPCKPDIFDATYEPA